MDEGLMRRYEALRGVVVKRRQPFDLVGKHVPLSDAEAQAVCYHDGQYVAENEPVAQKEEPLTLLVRWADCWPAHIFEDGREPAEDTDYFGRRPD